MKTLPILLILALLVVGCATSSGSINAGLLSIGMTKAEVIQTLGEPERFSAKSGKEVLEFDVRNVSFADSIGRMGMAFQGKNPDEFSPKSYDLVKVTLINGKVESYETIDNYK